MPEQFQNYTKQEVKEAIKQDIAALKRDNRFSLYELYNLAEKREKEQQNRIDNVPENVKSWTYKFARGSELRKLKKHHENILGSKAQRKSVDKFVESLNNKRNRDGHLSVDVIEREYSRNALEREYSIHDIFANQIVIPDKVQGFSTIEEQCKAILKSNRLDVNSLKSKVEDILGRMSGLDKELNVLGAYKTTFADKRALEKLMEKHPKELMMILRQGALQGAYNELTAHVANGGVDNVNLKKVGEIHKELIVGNLLINEFSMTSNYAYVVEPVVEAANAPEQKAEEEKKPEQKAEEEKRPEQKAEEEKKPEQKAEEEKRPEQKVEEEKKPEQKVEEEKKPEQKVEEEKKPEQKVEEKKKPKQKAEDKLIIVETVNTLDKRREEDLKAYKQKVRRAEAEKYVKEQQKKERDELIDKISSKYPIPDNASAEEKIYIAYNRMAALLGVDNNLQQPDEAKAYRDMLDVHDEINAILDDYSFETMWPRDVVEKVVDIQSMDRLFGVQRERKDYLGCLVKEDHIRQGKDGNNKTVTYYNYKDIVARKIGASKYFRKDLDKERKNKCMNIGFATKLSNLDFDDYEVLFKNLTSENLDILQNLKDKIKEAKKELKRKELVLIRKDIYQINSNINLIDEVLENDCAFHTYNSDDDLILSGNVAVEKLQYSGRPTDDSYEYKLREWMKNNEASKELDSFAPVYKEIEAYFEKVDTGKWLTKSYYDQFEKMAKAVYDWKDKIEKSANTSEDEKKIYKSLTTVYAKIYGAGSLKQCQNSWAKECEREDENAKIYYKLRAEYKKDEQIAQCDKKKYKGTAEEQQKERENEKAEIRKHYAKVLKNMVSDKTNVPLFPHTPCIEDIEQGCLGDCYLLASLAAIVKENPKTITSMMEDFGNVVLVKFDGKHSVFVSKKIFTSTSAKNALWVQIMEKAYAKAFQIKDQEVKNPNQDINNYESYFNKQQDAREFLEKQVQEEASLLKEKDAEKFLNRQMTTEALLKRAYFSTNLWISGGSSKNAINNIYGFTRTEQSIQDYALTVNLGDTEKAYGKLWDLTVKDNDEYKDSELKGFIRKQIQKDLLMEIAYRVRDNDNRSYKAVTIDDFVDALNDIKNWKNQDKGNVFYRLLTEVKTHFPYAEEADIMNCMYQMGDDLIEAGLKQDVKDEIVFGYRTDLKDFMPYYTPKAMDWYASMERAHMQNLEIMAGTGFFGDIFNGISSKKPTANGIQQKHEFTVTNVYKEGGHYFVTLRNPWARNIVEYRRNMKADGSVEITIGKIMDSKDASRGEFSLELNDFMNSFNLITIVDEVEKITWEMARDAERIRKIRSRRKV